MDDFFKNDFIQSRFFSILSSLYPHFSLSWFLCQPGFLHENPEKNLDKIKIFVFLVSWVYFLVYIIDISDINRLDQDGMKGPRHDMVKKG
jgi:hypothetical protein